MVLELRFRIRPWSQALSALSVTARTLVFLAVVGVAVPARAHADASVSSQRLSEAETLYNSGQYFKSARYAFAAAEEDDSLQAEAYSWVTISLIRANLNQTAAYFFIKTLMSGHKSAIHRVLTLTQDLMTSVGADLLRKYMIRHTTYEDYDSLNRSAYLYALGRDTLLGGDEGRSIGYLNGIDYRSPLWPYALQLRGTARAIRGENDAAISDFQECESQAKRAASNVGSGSVYAVHRDREFQDLQSRCMASQARVLYQMDRFEDADRSYDRIPKKSIVWPDILFEQAWNSFGRREYNRTLGKLVSYKSPALNFMFNTEVDVLRAQSYLALCLYSDANDVINEFNQHYTGLGEQVKRFVEQNSSSMNAFYEIGKEASHAHLYTGNPMYKFMNRFIRGPYFQNLMEAETATYSEEQLIRQFDSGQPGVAHGQETGFPGFLDLVLKWRRKTLRHLGGVFVKNSLLDYHSALIADYEKMAFIKLEMLSRAKEKLVYKHTPLAERVRGSVEPSRRDDQYYWSFNGEFWTDELGDYVFGLESECNKS